MSLVRTPLELLAPARDLECGLAAINHGADAVYIGAPKFGARAAAGNSLEDIAKLISYAHYFIRGRRRAIVSLRTPKSVGKLLGTVRSVGNGFFAMDSSKEIHNGDGICFFNDEDQLTGVNINQVEGSRVFPNSMEGIQPGVVLYRNYDHEFVQLLKSDTSRRKIGVSLFFNENEEGFELRALDEDGNEAVHRIKHEKELAKKPEGIGTAERCRGEGRDDHTTLSEIPIRPVPGRTGGR